MMTPDFYFKSVTCITQDFLKEQGIKALLLDVDNTLCLDEDPKLNEGVADWLKELKSAGIPTCLVSNNSQKRVEKLANSIKMPYVHRSLKPSRRGIIKAMVLLGHSKNNCAIIGDQIFTDIMGGRRAGIKTILVQPIDEKEILLVRVKRGFEKFFIKRFYRKGGRLRG